MATAKLRVMPFDVYAWSKDEEVLRMNIAERGAYLEMLFHQWHQGSLPASTAGLADICRMREEDFLKLWTGVVCTKFKKVGNRLYNGKVDNMRQQYTQGALFAESDVALPAPPDPPTSTVYPLTLDTTNKILDITIENNSAKRAPPLKRGERLPRGVRLPRAQRGTKEENKSAVRWDKTKTKNWLIIDKWFADRLKLEFPELTQADFRELYYDAQTWLADHPTRRARNSRIDRTFKTFCRNRLRDKRHSRQSKEDKAKSRGEFTPGFYTNKTDDELEIGLSMCPNCYEEGAMQNPEKHLPQCKHPRNPHKKEKANGSSVQ